MGTGAARPNFVVTGTGRSGTAYMARLLSAAGHSCGHEELFTPHTSGPPAFGERQGDSSWLAAPFLPGLPEGCVVLHQVRNPLEVLRSFLGIQMFDDGFRLPAQVRLRRQAWRLREQARARLGPGSAQQPPPLRADFGGFIRRHTPEVYASSDERVRGITHWVTWNRLVERAGDMADDRYVRYRLEDVDPALLARLDGLLGGDGDERRFRNAFATVPSDTNARARVEGFDLASMPGSPHLDELVVMAAEYGYRL
jgi:hypothetical protein